MEFQNVNPPQNPGAGFEQAFAGGQQVGLAQQQMAQQKLLSMAQMAQQQQQFNVTAQLEKERIAQQGAMNNANMSMMSAQTHQIEQATQAGAVALDQTKDSITNDAYLNTQGNPKINPDLYDPEKGAVEAQRILSNVPKPGALSAVKKNEWLGNIDMGRNQNTAWQNYKTLQADQVGEIAQGVKLQGSNITNFLTPQGQEVYKANPQQALSTPSLWNMADLSLANTKASVAMQRAATEFGTAQKLSELDAQGNWALQRMLLLTGQRGESAEMRAAQQDVDSARANLTKLRTSMADPKDIQKAAQDLDEATKRANQVMDQIQRGQPGTNMQNPSGTLTIPGAGTIPVTSTPQGAIQQWMGK